MSSDLSSREERAKVPQPVKKRGRFAAPTEGIAHDSEKAQHSRRRKHTEPVPQGFVRYELDEEDSEEDPDFEAEVDVLADEDDDDQYHDLENINDDELAPDTTRRSEAQLNHMLKSTRAHHSGQPHESRNEQLRGLSRSDDIYASNDPSFASQKLRSGEDPDLDLNDPDFEVDNLDSTDDEEEEEYEELEAHHDGSLDRNTYLPDGSIDFGDFHNTNDIEVDELDEAESDEYRDDTLENDEDEDEDDGDEVESVDGPEGAPDEYQQFLMGILAETDDGSAKDNGEVPSGLPPPSWALDDDDDFDYLRESAKVQDDPLEYRDDLQVSRKELVQLFSNNTAGLRRKTRHSRVSQIARPRQSTQSILALPDSHARGPAIIQTTGGPHHVLQGTLPSTQSGNIGPVLTQSSQLSSFVGTPSATFINLPIHFLSKFREQMSVHVQILTTVHAKAKKIARKEDEQHIDHQVSKVTEDPSANAVANRSETLLLGLVDNKKVSNVYHQALGTNLSRLKAFSERLLHRNRNAAFKYESCKTSVYNLPVLDLLEQFISDCKTANLQEMPTGVLNRFAPFSTPYVSQALRSRSHGRHYSPSNFRLGWFPWTAEDDQLLAMTMAKYGSNEVSQFSRDLLPHRQEDDCQARVKYLSSRRCPDNPVKRQVMLITSPLNTFEIEQVTRGLSVFGRGGNIDDASIWKQIQAELLPGREWSHLQKLWHWRETRRKYKAKYRARSHEKKKLAKERT